MPIGGGIYVGGLRQRLIKDSLFNLVNDSLELLGWFDPGRRHAPVTVVPEEQNTNGAVEIPLNTVAIADLNLTVHDWEMGSNMDMMRWPFAIDVFAESSTLGLHLSGDIFEIIRGGLPSIDRVLPILDVYDWQMPTPPLIFTCDIYDIARDRAHNFPQPYLRHWYSVSFEVRDYYTGENG